MNSIKESFVQFGNAEKEIFDYFGYVEGWVAIPLDFAIDYYWRIEGSDDSGNVGFALTVEALEDEYAEEYYEHQIYTQRFLPKWVYRGKDYTMICVDTQVDGNKFLQIFTNDKEIKS